MSWNCAAIEHGVTIFPNGKIGPCCQIKSEYLKPIKEISNPDRFADLKTEHPPDACIKCVFNEHQGISSYRQMFNNTANQNPGLQFVDIRNTNLCNLKCRYCGPHFSNRWAEELTIDPPIKHTSYNKYRDILFTPSLHWMYFTGGEPMINSEHWELLEFLINNNYAKNICLQYNTNLTTIKFKNKNIVNIWKSFKQVMVLISVDSVGLVSDQIRSGSDWNKISENIDTLITCSTQSKNIKISITPVLSILNLWSIKSLFDYARNKKISVEPMVLTGPDYLALDVVPDQLKPLALETLAQIQPFLNSAKYQCIKSMIENNINQCLFDHTVRHVLLLDKIRNENLFDYLPFKDYAIDHTLRNNEYE
jgi:sulfatase maturation enzyme AslB (radical SAM superfamily)